MPMADDRSMKHSTGNDNLRDSFPPHMGGAFHIGLANPYLQQADERYRYMREANDRTNQMHNQAAHAAQSAAANQFLNPRPEDRYKMMRDANPNLLSIESLASHLMSKQFEERYKTNTVGSGMYREQHQVTPGTSQQHHQQQQPPQQPHPPPHMAKHTMTQPTDDRYGMRMAQEPNNDQQLQPLTIQNTSHNIAQNLSHAITQHTADTSPRYAGTRKCSDQPSTVSTDMSSGTGITVVNNSGNQMVTDDKYKYLRNSNYASNPPDSNTTPAIMKPMMKPTIEKHQHQSEKFPKNATNYDTLSTDDLAPTSCVKETAQAVMMKQFADKNKYNKDGSLRKPMIEDSSKFIITKHSIKRVPDRTKDGGKEGEDGSETPVIVKQESDDDQTDEDGVTDDGEDVSIVTLKLNYSAILIFCTSHLDCSICLNLVIIYPFW